MQHVIGKVVSRPSKDVYICVGKMQKCTERSATTITTTKASIR